jgi:hypothetical protein
VKRAALTLLGVLAFSMTLAHGVHAVPSDCAAWSGEIDPLPSVSDPDPLRAAWARLRADQLAALAMRVEHRSRALAGRLWRHASCLDPERLDFAAGALRAAPVRWVRPQILGAQEVEVSEGDAIPYPVSREPWDLEEPIRVIVARVSFAEPGPLSAGASTEIAAAQDALRLARFELALEWVARGKEVLEAGTPLQEQANQRAQLEVLAATAQIALGQEAAARESLVRALRAQPALRLDPALHSPKLVQLLDLVRREDGSQP